MYPRIACRVPQALLAARSVPLVNPSPNSGACRSPPFILPHALCVGVIGDSKLVLGLQAMPQPPLLVYCQLSTDYCPFEAPTRF